MAPERLGQSAVHLIEDRAEELVFSVVSIWEAAIKAALGRAEFTVSPRRLRQGLLNGGYQELTINGVHVLATGDLPLVHRDPFDRMLLAQAHHEGRVLATSDRTLARYPVAVRVV